MTVRTVLTAPNGVTYFNRKKWALAVLRRWGWRVANPTAYLDIPLDVLSGIPGWDVQEVMDVGWPGGGPEVAYYRVTDPFWGRWKVSRYGAVTPA